MDGRMGGWMEGWVDEWMSVRPNSIWCLSKSPTFDNLAGCGVLLFPLFWFTKNCQALQRSRRGAAWLFLLETWSNHGGIFTLLEGGSFGRDLCLASSSFQVGPSHWSGCVLGVATMEFAIFFFFSDVSCERSEMAQEHALALEGCLESFDDANGSAYCLTKWTCCMFFGLHIMAFLGVQADGETKMCNKKHSLMLLVPKATCAVCLCDYVEGEVLRRCRRETMGGILSNLKL